MNREEWAFASSDSLQDDFHVPEDPEMTENREQNELMEYAGLEFVRLEALAAGVYSDHGETMSLAGVEIPKSEVDAESSQKIDALKQRISQVLVRAGRSTLRLGKAALLTTALATGYTAVNLEKPEHFEQKDEARQELMEEGITSEQRLSAYKPGISEMLYRSILPYGYQNSPNSEGFLGKFLTYLDEKGIPNTEALQQVIPNLVFGRDNRAQQYEVANAGVERERRNFDQTHQTDNRRLTPAETQKIEDLYAKYNHQLYEKAWGNLSDLNAPISTEQFTALDDAWRLYLGLPQQRGSFGISDYKPAQEKEDKYYYAIKDFWNSFLSKKVSVGDDNYWYELSENKEISRETRMALYDLQSPKAGLRGRVELIKKLGKDGKLVFSGTEIGETGGDVLYHYTASLGRDEQGYYISYYDKWDLASLLAANPITKGVGRSFEIYDRLYYDPVTFEVIPDQPK